MEPQTTYHKGRDGWTGETSILMGEAKDSFDRPAQRYLHIMTMKSSSGKLFASAKAVLKRDGMISFVIFGDFGKTIATSSERCTEKSIRRLHETALTQADTVLAEARAFYANKEAEKQRKAA